MTIQCLAVAWRLPWWSPCLGKQLAALRPPSVSTASPCFKPPRSQASWLDSRGQGNIASAGACPLQAAGKSGPGHEVHPSNPVLSNRLPDRAERAKTPSPRCVRSMRRAVGGVSRRGRSVRAELATAALPPSGSDIPGRDQTRRTKQTRQTKQPGPVVDNAFMGVLFHWPCAGGPWLAWTLCRSGARCFAREPLDVVWGIRRCLAGGAICPHSSIFISLAPRPVW